VTVFIWLTGILACTADCTSAPKKHDCCHESPSHKDKSLCWHNQAIAPAQVHAHLVNPFLGIALFSIPSVANAAADASFISEFFRHASERPLVSRHEVCPGPGFRSLAPPALL